MKAKTTKKTKPKTRSKGWQKHLPSRTTCKVCGHTHTDKAHREHGVGVFRKTHPSYRYKTTKPQKRRIQGYRAKRVGQ